MISLKAFLKNKTIKPLEIYESYPGSSLWVIGTYVEIPGGTHIKKYEPEFYYFGSYPDAEIAMANLEQYLPDYTMWHYHTTYALKYNIHHVPFGEITPEQWQEFKQAVRNQKALKG